LSDGLPNLFGIGQQPPVIAEQLAIFSDPRLGMFQNRDQIESDKEVSGRAARTTIKLVDGLLDGVGALATAAEFHQFFEAWRVADNLRIEPGIRV